MDEKQMLSALRRDVRAWNRLRETHPKLRPRLAGENFQSANLNDADLRGLHLGRANLHKAKLRRAKLSGAVLAEADLREADLEGAEMIQTVLQQADLRKANLTGVWMIEGNLVQTNLIGANLYGAKLQSCDLFQAQLDEADLREANLQESRLISASLRKANLTGASVFGIAAWNLDLEGAIQKDLVITSDFDGNLTTADDIEMAQFLYLLLNNQKIRNVIDTITTKVVLILGRFLDERKAVLDAIRDELRNRNYLPVLFDFQGPANRDLTETVSTLAHMARFIIADLTDPRSIPQELSTIVPQLPSVPVQPIILWTEQEWGMFEHFTRYPWVLPIVKYEDVEGIISNLTEQVIEPAEKRAREQLARRQ
jgi:uncharacterized protein YjbI with pentapeptide repeats